MKQTEIEKLVPFILRNSKVYYLVITDLEGKYIYVNELFQNRFSFLTDNFIGYPSQKTVHPEDNGKCAQASVECIMNPNSGVEVKVRKPENTGNDYYWTQWEFSLFQDKNNNPIGILCLGHDITETQNSILKAKEYSEKIESMIENITDGFYVLDRNWKILAMNLVAEDTFKVTPGSLLNKYFWDTFPDNPAYKYPIEFRKAMTNNCTVRFKDFYFETGRWFSIVAYPSKEGLTVFFREITNEKKMEAELLDSKSKLSAILDSSSDSNILISPDYKIISFNRSAYQNSLKLINRELKEMTSILEYIMPEDRIEFNNDFQNALDGHIIRKEKEIQFEDFRIWTEVSLFPVYGHEKKVIAITYNAMNIEKRKRAEEKLKRSEYILSAIYNSSSQGITIIDKNLIIIYFNKVIQTITNEIFEREIKVGNIVLEFLFPDLKTEFSNYFHKVLEGETFQIEKKYKQKWWLFSLYPVYDEEHKLVGIANNLEDITERKKNELRVIHQNEKLKSIAWNQSHQVRKHVANILGLCIQIKDENLKGNPNQTQYLNYLNHSAEELDKIIHRIVSETDTTSYDI